MTGGLKSELRFQEKHHMPGRGTHVLGLSGLTCFTRRMGAAAPALLSWVLLLFTSSLPQAETEQRIPWPQGTILSWIVMLHLSALEALSRTAARRGGSLSSPEWVSMEGPDGVRGRNQLGRPGLVRLQETPKFMQGGEGDRSFGALLHIKPPAVPLRAFCFLLAGAITVQTPQPY